MSSIYQKAYFLLSAADVKQLPPDEGIEVAIVGRSNAGKSSVLNTLTQNKKLARVSKTPGRTQLLNTFVLDDTRRLIDLPGYGFAKAAPKAKASWERAINMYMTVRKSLKGLILVMDARHPLKDMDHVMLDFAQHKDLPVHILLNKADKLSRPVMKNTMEETKRALTVYSNPVTLQSFSAMHGDGVKELVHILDEWYEYKI